ncbi:AzlD domain-containing protein [Clostridiaceae bacterium HSG29]|nr:AzlD domain-containing protein [Clostridiaceae bacterium HSG29]
MNKLLIIIVGMALVTYIPRMLPLVYLSNSKRNRFLKDF